MIAAYLACNHAAIISKNAELLLLPPAYLGIRLHHLLLSIAGQFNIERAVLNVFDLIIRLVVKG